MSAPRQSLDSSEATLHDLSTAVTRSDDVAAHRAMSDCPPHPPGQRETFHTKERSTACDQPKPSVGRWEHACLNTTPGFFSMNMGTGIASILLYNLPYNARWLEYLGMAVFIINIILFALISISTIVRHVRWKGIFRALVMHVSAGMYWGCMPMGLATIINMIAFVCVPRWGYRWAQLALGMWWIDVVLSITINFGMLFMIFARQTHTLETISAALLLPIVSSVVAAASGGVVSRALAPFDPELARSTIIVSYTVWGTGVPVAMFFITLWIYRTAVVGLPAPATLPSLFLPLGPCGQGSFGIMTLGIVVRELAYTYGIGFAISHPGGNAAESMLWIADGVYAAGLATGLVLWGLGLVWYALGMWITLDHIARNRVYLSHKSFSNSWTGYTFPIGVWATATTTLATELDSPAFKVLGTIVSVQVIFHWLYVFSMSCWKACEGSFFNAPELSEWEDRRPPLRWSKAVGRDMV